MNSPYPVVDHVNPGLLVPVAPAWVGHTSSGSYVFRLVLDSSGSGTLAFSYPGADPVVEGIDAWHIDGGRVVLRGDLGAETSLQTVGAAIQLLRRGADWEVKVPMVKESNLLSRMADIGVESGSSSRSPTFESLGFEDPLAQGRLGAAITLRLLDGADVFKQVTLHTDSAGVWQAQLRVARPGLPARSSSCAASSVAHHIDALHELRVRPMGEPRFVIHGNQYAIWVVSGVTLSHFEFDGVPGSDEDVLQVWADGLLHSVELCKASETPAGGPPPEVGGSR